MFDGFFLKSNLSVRFCAFAVNKKKDGTILSSLMVKSDYPQIFQAGYNQIKLSSEI
jgi:hypothetical protein